MPDIGRRARGEAHDQQHRPHEGRAAHRGRARRRRFHPTRVHSAAQKIVPSARQFDDRDARGAPADGAHRWIVQTAPACLGSDGKGRASHWRLPEVETDDALPTKDFLRWDGTRYQKPPRKNKTTANGVGHRTWPTMLAITSNYPLTVLDGDVRVICWRQAWRFNREGRGNALR
jgi:hypothetical protein